MTEDDWLSATDPQEMLRACGTLSDRKRRLFAAACCRSIWNLLADEDCRRAVEVAERYAGGEADDDAMYEANTVAWMVYYGYAYGGIDFTPGRQVDGEAVKSQRVGRAASAAVLAAAWWGPDEEWRSVSGGPTEAVCTALLLGTTSGEDSGVSNIGGRWHHPALCHLLRDIVADPFRSPSRLIPSLLDWSGGLVVRLAEATYAERELPSGRLDGARLAVLADALEDAGCADDRLLGHLRSQGPHVRGCWAVDMVLGKG